MATCRQSQQCRLKKLFSCQCCRKNKRNNIVVKTKGRLKGGDVKQHYYIMEQTTTIEVKMNNCFNHFNNEKKKATGKQHFHVMEAIRKMEPAWKKIAASNFRLGLIKMPTVRCTKIYKKSNINMSPLATMGAAKI